MTKRAKFTQAELERAWKVASKHGAVVEVRGGAIRLLAREDAAPLTSPEADGDEEKCDEAFGTGGFA